MLPAVRFWPTCLLFPPDGENKAVRTWGVVYARRRVVSGDYPSIRCFPSLRRCSLGVPRQMNDVFQKETPPPKGESTAETYRKPRVEPVVTFVTLLMYILTFPWRKQVYTYLYCTSRYIFIYSIWMCKYTIYISHFIFSIIMWKAGQLG